jgi:predicted RNA binding protein YcfA (HicA-like mRNA interferase family)
VLNIEADCPEGVQIILSMEQSHLVALDEGFHAVSRSGDHVVHVHDGDVSRSIAPVHPDDLELRFVDE